MTAASRGRLREPVDDRGAALGESGDHLALGAQRFVVRVGGRDPDIRPRERTMAAGDAIGLEPECRDADHVPAVQREQAVRRADELDVVVVAAGAGVAHHLRDRQFLQRVVEGFLQAIRERTPRGDRAQEHGVRLAVGLDREAVGAIGIRPQVGEVRAAHPGELSSQRDGRLAPGIERHGFRHELLRERLVGRSRQHVRDRHAEPPRRRVRRDRARRGPEAALGEPRDDAVGECLAEPLQRLRRQLLGEELHDQCRRAGHAARTRSSSGSIGKPSASREST